MSSRRELGNISEIRTRKRIFLSWPYFSITYNTRETENRYYGTLKLMKSQLLKRKTKYQLYKTVILATVLCGYESWTLSKGHGPLLGGFERKILRRMYGTVQIGSVRRRRYTKELYSLFNDV
jgi:hypothetical protein